MVASRPPVRPASAPPVGLNWNRFGWFGSQVGGSVWLLLLAPLLHLLGDTQAAVAVVLVFAVANLGGWRLWIQRQRRSARSGYLILLGVQMAAAGLGLWIAGASEVLVLHPAIYLYLLVYPLVALMLLAVDRAGQRALQRRRGR